MKYTFLFFSIILLTFPLLAAAQYSLPNVTDTTLNQLQKSAPPEIQDGFRQLQELQRLIENLPAANEGAAPGNDFIIDLVWRADTFVPAGYAGKALPIGGSTITIVALTSLKNPANLEYSWIIEDSSSSIQGPEAQGRGLDSFTFRAESRIPNFTHRLKLIVTEPRTGETATMRIEIPVKKPEVHLYTTDPWPQRINSRFSSLPDETFTVIARTFYFTTADISQLDFSWRVGGERLLNDEEPNTLQLKVNRRTPIGTEQSISLSVSPRGVLNNFNQQAQVSSRFVVGP